MNDDLLLPARQLVPGPARARAGGGAPAAVLIGRRGLRDLGKDTAKATSLAAGALAIPEIVVPPPAAALADVSAPVAPAAGGQDGDGGPGPA